MKYPARLLVTISLFVLAACSQTGRQIGSNLSLCCPGDYGSYREYRLEVIDMPLFLRNYVVQEFEAAFLEKGLRRDDTFSDLRVVLRYNHINLNPEEQDINPFVRVEALNVELDYIAEIIVEMYETRSNDQVWEGSISRIHHVTPGEYMHEERARPEFLNAFRELLVNYPSQ
ncbi:MAG: DUF4136 domain-containing protein [Gammaproteobacteria bacterium]